ncbi:hypothetical protein CYLTODRAFT_495074 [Cylindrobasidium torrendii FP15055 ss-10]|uniref:Uncharacterized protein n=1 Tax=Cylindrobasidium torrendii FP15055 ss-10 TaxID=1314674 RepID=A0A0D7AUU3_9AGAR|nr:hypothetical protein CYLTODRAFT_495074 [Cylindrobasidium torrendii FP15055 ss-10]
MTQGLRRLGKDAVDSISDSSLERALKAAHSSSIRARRMLFESQTDANLALYSTTHAVALTPGYILEQCIPDLQIHFQCEYSRAIYPCWKGNSSTRLLQPHGAVTSALTMPLFLHSIEDDNDNGGALADDDTPFRDLPEICDPLLQGHIIRTQYGHNKIPFPVLFVALSDEIYQLLASAVLHRRTLGLHTPCLAFAHDSINCQLRAVWAWSASHGDHPCIEIQVAHAPWSTTPSPALGVFDVHDKDSAAALAMYLHGISEQLRMDFLNAQKNAPDTHAGLLKNPTIYWRVDQDKFFQGRPSRTADIAQWLREVEASPDVPGTPSQEEDDERMESPIEEPFDDTLAQAQTALAGARHALERWKALHRDILFAELSHWYESETVRSGAADLTANFAFFCGMYVKKCAFPPSEFPELQTTPEPLKICREYARCFLPKRGDLLSDLSRVTLPTLPKEIHLEDDEPAMDIPCTLEAREDIEAFLNFCAAAEIENWMSLMLKLMPVAPLGAEMTTYLIDNLPTFLKVCELCSQANLMPGGNASLYEECFDLLFGLHGDVGKVYRRFGQQIFTARHRLFDETHTLANEGLELPHFWSLDMYTSNSNMSNAEYYLAEHASLDDLTPPKSLAKKCFERMAKMFEQRVEAARYEVQKRSLEFVLFKEYWNVSGTNKGVGAAALHATTFDDIFCDAVLCTTLPMEITPGDLDAISLFGVESPRTSSTSSHSVQQPQLPETLREPLETVIDEVLPPASNGSDVPRQLGISDSQSPRQQEQYPDNLLALLLPLAFLEYKQGFMDPEKGADRTCYYLTMACRLLISLGIYDFPIFGLSTSRSRVRLFCAWAAFPRRGSPFRARNPLFNKHLDRIQSDIYIADANCPEWDISKPRDAIRLGLFLQHLRTTHRDRLEKKFNEVKQEVSESWKNKANWTPRERTLRQWKMSQQKDGAEYKKWVKEATEAWPEFSRLQAQVDHAQGAVDQATAELKEDSDDTESDDDY